ncbi:DUF1641 domain-containing protein [Gracilibacillus salinarum]|uniref:DUF1641 domain-containing protein n=1 Tax=Gracilibacillus salinarum TaxID=2932255 RepID=A0ABY4GGP7_9BACI|nr:DUF1641 domain-containing protein [Gracilibacillus salinarum]UOQ83498.1 DUF1641 domain-containing protein [Gracilibacillus salinarum]
MGRAIKQIERIERSAEEIKADDLSAILTKVADNREAIEECLIIVEELHKAEVLPALKSFLKTRQEVGVLAVEQLNQPGMHNIIKNGMAMLQLLAAIDTAKLDQLTGGLNQGIEKAAKSTEHNEDIGLFGLMKATNDPNVKRSLNMMIQFLHGMGEGLAESQDVKQ